MIEGRFVEGKDGKRDTLYSLMHEFLVVCPQCQSCALIFKLDPTIPDIFAPRRLSCGKCGYTKDWAERFMSHSGRGVRPVDSCFGLPLWLTASGCGHVLWAFNMRHLQLIEQYVAADLRQSFQHHDYGWFNKSLFNRLPKWVELAKNRTAVLKTIDKLKRK